MNTPHTLPLAITMGDPNGIGPELCVKLFAEGVTHPAFVIGDIGVLTREIKTLGASLNLRAIHNAHECSLKRGTMDVMAASNLPPSLQAGAIDAHAGQAAYDYVIKAIDLTKTKAIAGIVTAPLAKESIKQAGIPYPGHTEILADKTRTNDYAMMLANDELRVILVTIHIALKDVAPLITKARVLKTIHLAATACASYGIIKPRIAVSGLNPHAGENGMFGQEEIDHIIPAITEARTEGLDVSGPYAGDTIFMRARKGEFDIVVAQYHDQGLIPVKYLGIEQGVNVTVGLPFIRTSVDHGTAFDIAGQGIADHSSLRYAFNQALRMVKAAAS
ncbi:MAG: 4-hydroxythreonine-4-phosphate dehydrogenase PdxA [Alphaproteobacteria bacterium]|nr:4-hydroxythreonine-4-phosphate dehydrogenase PdxA [Alphaproteobacteria bacterium]